MEQLIINSKWITDENTTICAIYISAPNDECLKEARKSIDEYLPHTWELPCGNVFSAAKVEDIPLENVPCPCGNKNHWLVKIKIDPSLDRRNLSE